MSRLQWALFAGAIVVGSLYLKSVRIRMLIDPLHATLQEFAAEGFTRVECARAGA
jgi:hypothetical protein